MSEDTTLEEFTETVGETESEESTEQELFGLGKIPTDWSIESLSNIAEIIPGNSPPSSTYNDKGEGLPFFQGNSEFGYFHPIADTWCSEPRKEANKNDVLMSIRAPVGDLNIADRNCCIGRGLAALRPETVNGLYLFYNLAERKPWLSRLATGSTFKSVTKGDLQLLNVPIPSLSEQRKIATVLHNVDQAIQKTEEIIGQTLKIKNRTIDRLTMKGVDHDNFKHVDTSLRFFELEIPEEWEKVSYEDISSNITYGFTSPMPEAESGPWMVTAKDIKNGRVNYSTARKTTEEAFSERLTSKSRPEPGTVLITKDGTLGNVAIVDREGICINQSVASINPNQEKVRPEFLALTLTSPLTRKLTESFNPQTTIGHIKISELAEWELGLPPISEQEEIVSIVESIQKKYRSEKEYKNSLQRLKSGLMQDLLSGTVRTTDTNIEVLDEIAQHG